MLGVMLGVFFYLVIGFIMFRGLTSDIDQREFVLERLGQTRPEIATEKNFRRVMVLMAGMMVVAWPLMIVLVYVEAFRS